MSRVDVIIPCYNYGRFLRECVESVLTQQVDLRVLIIDDCSSDETPQVAAALAAEDPRIEVRRHAVNRGHIATFNEGLAWVSGDYNLLLSADDLLTEGALLRASRLMDAHPEVGLAYGRVIPFRSSAARPAIEPREAGDKWSVIPGVSWLESICRESSNGIYSPEAIVRTRLQKELGGYRAQLPHTADMDMWMRFAAHADVGRLDAFQAYYRLHGRNMSDVYFDRAPLSTSSRPNVKDFQEREATFDLFFSEQRPSLPGCDRLEGIAREGLAWNAFWSASQLFEEGDAEGCRRFLDLARGAFPGIVERPEWSRMKWKQRLGTRVWSKLRHLIRAIRSGRRSSHDPRVALS
jgi:glycosyltransferase involved in cell wall biosynthesis